MSRDCRDDSKVFFPEVFDSVVEVNDLALEHISKITLMFWKPIELPIDLTVVVPAR